MASILDRGYRDGVRAYILSLAPEKKKDFELSLLNRVQLHRRDLRDLKELLLEESSALAFLQEHLRVVPFNREEREAKQAVTDSLPLPIKGRAKTA
jgi:hypothetical protein